MVYKTTCPICGKKGRSVDNATLKSMLAVSLRLVQDSLYRFCASPDCDVVYYSESSTQTFTTRQVRERVYQKELGSEDVLICYCFQHTTLDVRQHVAKSLQATLIADINSGIRAGQCACDWRNPQGNCCLGNIRQLVKQLETETTSNKRE